LELEGLTSNFNVKEIREDDPNYSKNKCSRKNTLDIDFARYCLPCLTALTDDKKESYHPKTPQSQIADLHSVVHENYADDGQRKKIDKYGPMGYLFREKRYHYLIILRLSLIIRIIFFCPSILAMRLLFFKLSQEPIK